MKLIKTSRPPLNVFEVKRTELQYDDSWKTIYEVEAYKVPKTAVSAERVVDTACIMTGVLVTNPGSVTGLDPDIEVSARIETQLDIPEYGTVPTTGDAGDVFRVGRKLYVFTDTNVSTLFLDELAVSGTNYVDTSDPTNYNVGSPETFQDAITAALAALSTGDAFTVSVDGVSNDIVYVKVVDGANTVAAPIRKRYILINKALVPSSDFASISLERQVMKTGDRLQLRLDTQDIGSAVSHFSFILNQREEFTRLF